ncbi:MAG: hypothetical protein PHN44_10250 [Candidatus Marinimicrobia bacterium]|nr:hypothetical protein [Candidatus Neomarinimicrobiota bacterium]
MWIIVLPLICFLAGLLVGERMELHYLLPGKEETFIFLHRGHWYSIRRDEFPD